MKYFLFFSIITACLMACNGSNEPVEKQKSARLGSNDKNQYSHLMMQMDTVQDMYRLLCQGWEMEDDVESLKGMSANSIVEIPFRSFYLADDGSFISNSRNAMDYGNWQFNQAAKTITLNYTVQKDKLVYKIASLAPNELQVKNISINTESILKFISPGTKFINAADEPFALQNNRWRIKPAKKESPAEIKERLKQHIHFFVLYYRSVVARNDASVSFWGLPTCFKWYGGGIFLKKPADLPENWVRCFYNQEQALQASDMAEKLLQGKYDWPKGISWVKQNLAVLEQMYKAIDSLN